MARVKDRMFWESERFNNATFMQYYNRLVELSIAMFEWKNLPEEIDARFLELILFGDGAAVFFRDERAEAYAALRVMYGGELNMYEIPTKRTAYSTGNNYNANLDESNSVIIFNNLLHSNSVLEITNYAKRLWDLDRTIDINAAAQKTPILLQCDESQRLTLLNMYKQYSGNMPVVFGNKGLQQEPIKVLSTGAPYVCDKLYTLKTQIWNEALTYLGISNVSFQKRERLISDEVMRSMGGTMASRFSRLEARRQAAAQINKMFGLNISVDFRETNELLEDALSETEEAENEQIYN